MLSEEEKKAIKIVNSLKEWGKIHFFIKDSSYARLSYNEVYILLNFITKLQKQIEHQKEKRENQKVELAILNEKQKEMNKLKNTVSSYHGMFKKQEKEIKKLQKENEEKDKQIYLMSEEIFYKLNTDKFEYGYSINEVKTKFEKLAKEKGE